MTATATAETQELGKIIERIQGLLNKGNGTTNVHEADAFLAKAYELITRYNLTETQVTAGKARKNEEFHNQRVNLGDDGNIAWRRQLLHDLCGFNFCAMVYTRGTAKAHLVGERHNIQVVVYLYAYLARNIIRVSNLKWYEQMIQPSYQRDSSNGRAFKNAFCNGAVRAIWERLTEQKERLVQETNSSALIVVKEIELTQAMEKFHGRIKRGQTNKVRDTEGWKQGYKEGREMPINPALKSNS